jgi:hypothetical protein
MAYLTGPAIAAVGAPGEVHDTQKNPLLMEAWDASGQKYVYLKGIGSTITGSVVTFDEAAVTTLIAANAIGPVALATAAVVANKFGWYLVKGTQNVSCDAGIVDNAKVYIDGTAGRVDDTVVAGDQIIGAVFRGTDSSNLVSMQVDNPYVTDSLG